MSLDGRQVSHGRLPISSTQITSRRTEHKICDAKSQQYMTTAGVSGGGVQLTWTVFLTQIISYMNRLEGCFLTMPQ